MRSITKVIGILLFFVTTALISTTAQSRRIGNKSQHSEEYVYQSVEQMPQYPGGDAALMKYVKSQIQYPDSIKEEGMVMVQFVVKKDGSIGETKVARKSHPAFNEEALRVVKTLPSFIPGMKKGEPVNVWYTLPISFKPTNGLK